MRPLRLLGPALFLAGLAVLGLAVARGEATLFVVLVVPVVTATGPLAFVGILLVFAGFFASFVFRPSGVVSASPGEDVPPPGGESGAPSTRRWGGIAFLGPFPIVFGSDPHMSRLMLAIGILLFLALLALTLYALLA